LELNPPVMGWEGWEDAKAVYPSVGADQERDVVGALTSVVGRLPSSQLFVLDLLVRHLREMIDSTKTEEANEVYVTKLALSLGRNILRPNYDTELTIGDRTPSLFFADLITFYSQIFPPLVDKKKKETGRIMPVRKRTVLVDQRISRSRLSGDADPRNLLEAQHALQNPPRKGAPSIPEAGAPPTASALGLSEPVHEEPDEEKEPPFVPPSFAPPSIEPAEADRPPGFAPPSFAEPNDSDDEGGEREDISPTAQYLASVEQSVEDTPVVPQPAATGAAAGLKRNVSGEAGRLRGPRGARGPRPAPGARVPSTSTAE